MNNRLVVQLVYFCTAILLVVSCSSGDLKDAKSNCIEIMSASSETHFPGVYSNLRSNTDIELRIKKNCKDEVELQYILMDDILIEVRSVKQDSTWMMDDFKLKGLVDFAIVRGSRYAYNDEAPITHEVVEYLKSGKSLDAQVALMYKLNGSSVISEAQTLTKKKEVIHN